MFKTDEKKKKKMKLLSWRTELAEISVHEDKEKCSFGLT
jgi:hypothetical protein